MVSFYCFVTKACARRPDAAASAERKRHERRTLLAGAAGELAGATRLRQARPSSACTFSVHKGEWGRMTDSLTFGARSFRMSSKDATMRACRNAKGELLSASNCFDHLSFSHSTNVFAKSYCKIHSEQNETTSALQKAQVHALFLSRHAKR